MLSNYETERAAIARPFSLLGGAMDREQMARIALRYDTQVSRAMLRALGVPIPERKPKRRRARQYDGVRTCFKNKRRDGRDILA